MSPKHFLNYEGLSKEFIISIIDRGLELKSLDQLPKSLENKSLGLIFEKPSTRTRVSFEIGIQKLGGNSIFLSSSDLQMSRGEPISDTAKVLSSMLDAVVIRTTNHELLEIFSKNSSVPVINGLSDLYHPCQILADLMTFKEFQGNLDISKVAWIGDSNNVCNSYIEAAKLLDFNLYIYCPKGYEPNSAVMKSQKNNVVLTENKENALKEAKIVTTDVWTSMHSENQTQEKSKSFDGYSVDPSCMELAHEEAIFLHCLPAHRGEEVSIDMLEHSSSKVWSQAENRLHVQQALLERLLLD